MKTRKFDYLYVLQGHYAHGWEDLTAEDMATPGAMTRIIQSKREYRENEDGIYRIIERRERRAE